MRKLVLALALFSTPALAAGDILMHRDPGCGCCEQWAARVRQAFGRNVRIVDDANRTAFQRQVGLPANLVSCHTAIVDGIAFEGHPNMKRIYLAEDWEGYPLRKDYPVRGYKDRYNPYGVDREEKD